MSESLSRRRFLHFAGALGGSGAVYQAAIGLGLLPDPALAFSRPDIAPLRNTARRVVILGAGIAGLTAAYELSRKGYECVVFEASHRAGGRNLTLRHGDLVDETGNRQICEFEDEPNLFFNAGPARIPGHHQTLLEYCRELGVELAPFINENRNAWVQDDATFGGKPVRNREYITDSRGFLAELIAKGLRSELLDAELSNEDVARLMDFLRSYGDLDDTLRYRGSPRAGYVSYDYTVPGTLKPVRHLPELLKSRFHRFGMHFCEEMDQAAMMMEPVGGMDRIVQAFMQHVGRMVKTRAMVESVMLRDDGVDVVYRHNGERHKVSADFCLNNIPFQLMAGLEHNFPTDYTGCFTAVERGGLLKIGLQARERFWEREQIYGGISWTSEDILQIWYPCHGIHRRKGVILGAYIFGGPGAERFERMTHAQRMEAAIRQGSKIHPDYGRYIENGVTIAWRRMNHMLGCSAAWTDSVRTQWFKRIQQPLGRHFMIGDQVSYHPGWQQGAMHSALYAVSQIDQRVREEMARGVAA